MRGLYASIQIPSPLASNGGGQAAFEYLELLVRHAEVDVVTFVGPGREAWLPPLRDLAADVVAVPWHPSPAMRLGRYVAASLRRGVWRPLLNRPFLDAVHDRLRTGGYDFVQVDWTELAAEVHPPSGLRFLCGAHDVREKLAARAVDQVAPGRTHTRLRRRWERARREEAALFRRADAVLTLSESDATRARELAPMTPVFPVVYRRAVPAPAPDPSAREPHTLLYVGDFSRRVNLDIAATVLAEILPRVRRELPAARLVLAGGGAGSALRTRAARAGAEVTGYVSDLDDVYRRATVLLAPIPIGGGVHIKMIEAMSAALPVVTSSVGNDGIAAVPGRSILLAETAPEFAATAVQLLLDPARAGSVGHEGRRHVQRQFGMDRARSLLERALAHVFATPPRSPS